MKPAPLNATFLDIPLPPSTNNLFVNVVGKGRRKSGEYKSWCNAAAWKIRASDNYARFRGPFSVEIVLPPDMTTYSVCSMMMNPAAASGCLGGTTRLQHSGG